MKKFELNPKEELKLEVYSDTLAKELQTSKIYILAGVSISIVSWFFMYVMQDIPNFLPLLLMCLIILAICVLRFTYLLWKAFTRKNDKKYYITNVRTVIVDKNGVITQELIHSKIKSIEIEKVFGNAGTIFLNKKEDTSRKAAVKKVKNPKPIYTADTVIIESIPNANSIKELLENLSKSLK